MVHLVTQESAGVGFSLAWIFSMKQGAVSKDFSTSPDVGSRYVVAIMYFYSFPDSLVEVPYYGLCAFLPSPGSATLLYTNTYVHYDMEGQHVRGRRYACV